VAEYPTFTPADLAGFSGRPEASYPSPYTDEALKQATLLFKIGTCLATFPDDPMQADLAKYAILSMADYIVLNQPNAQVLAGPFQSESLGSYSYSKMAKTAASGGETGVAWFDLAVDQIGQCDQNDEIMSGGGIEVFEFDAEFAVARTDGNTVRVLSPKDQEYHERLTVPHDPNGLTRN
jgi:hypothetical protein